MVAVVVLVLAGLAEREYDAGSAPTRWARLLGSGWPCSLPRPRHWPTSHGRVAALEAGIVALCVGAGLARVLATGWVPRPFDGVTAALGALVLLGAHALWGWMGARTAQRRR